MPVPFRKVHDHLVENHGGKFMWIVGGIRVFFMPGGNRVYVEVIEGHVSQSQWNQIQSWYP